ncbi:leu operon leader peptide [Xenorhabdus sp. DI]|nr:leu operon leader peptide [Xenorhabdus sp. 3]MBD2787706.1 leu operon leader peptide [Xenorhabdus sp. DI]MBD2797572.1 leu operon leader peptide [Xenorhabdus sp. 18]
MISPIFLLSLLLIAFRVRGMLVGGKQG